MVMRHYIFLALTERMLFRGAFSIGNYIEDSKANTVMGEALVDAAQWYEKSDWMGLIATPKTHTAIEFYTPPSDIRMKHYLIDYPVPMKNTPPISLFCISWPGAFRDHEHMRRAKKTSSKSWFLEIFKDFSYPAHVASKYHNTKLFFDHVEQAIINEATTSVTGSAPLVEE
jgi:hypothetical protein